MMRRLQPISQVMVACCVAFVGAALVLVSCQSGDARYEQYFAQGQVLYEKNCSNCHQKNGRGLGLLYPPLAGSDYIGKNPDAVYCLMKYGIRGPLTVSGKEFNKPMPGVPSLTELEIAEIATYLNNAWSPGRGRVEISQVKQALEKCAPK